MTEYRFWRLDPKHGNCEASWYGLRPCGKRALYVCQPKGGLLCGGCAKALGMR